MSDSVEILIQAITRGAGDEVDALIDATPALAEARSAQGIGVILIACYHGQAAIAERIAARRGGLDLTEALVLGRNDQVLKLLAADASAANGFAPDGFSMLGLAVFFGQVECASLLLGAGADVNAAARNPMRVAPVHAAAAQASEARAMRLMRLLLAFGVDVDAGQQAGWTALHSAAHRDYGDLVALLLAAGADRERRNDDGRSARDLATQEQRARALAALAPAST